MKSAKYRAGFPVAHLNREVLEEVSPGGRGDGRVNISTMGGEDALLPVNHKLVQASRLLSNISMEQDCEEYAEEIN